MKRDIIFVCFSIFHLFLFINDIVSFFNRKMHRMIERAAIRDEVSFRIIYCFLDVHYHRLSGK